MKSFLIALCLLFSVTVFAGTEMRPSVADYPPNALNRLNTYEQSGITEFQVTGVPSWGATEVRFAIGFWGTPIQIGDAVEYPYAALISWTPGGWMVVKYLSPLWFDELGMHMGSNYEDLREYKVYIGQVFSPLITPYMISVGVPPKKNWEVIRGAVGGLTITDTTIEVK
jgi:hypothetical protein